LVHLGFFFPQNLAKKLGPPTPTATSGAMEALASMAQKQNPIGSTKARALGEETSKELVEMFVPLRIPMGRLYAYYTDP